MWGRTPLDRLAKFGGEVECGLVARAVCAFIKGGVRTEEDGAGGFTTARSFVWQKSAARIVTEIEALPDAWPFLRPVTEQEAPGYFQEISHPMDLSTVRCRLEARFYHNARAWQADLRLMLANALQYNRPKDIVYKLALSVGRALEDKVASDQELYAAITRAQEEELVRPKSPLLVRVAEGWHVPPPINHTEVRLQKMKRRALKMKEKSRTASSSTPRPFKTPKKEADSDQDLAYVGSTGPRSPVKPSSPTPAGAGSVSKEESATKMWRRECARALKCLWRHKESWPFLEPVDPVALQVPTYFEIIKHPMDLGTVRTKLNDCAYSKAEEFAADVRLVFRNAVTFNPKDHWVYAMAVNLRNLFENTWIECTMRLERNRMDLK